MNREWKPAHWNLKRPHKSTAQSDGESLVPCLSRTQLAEMGCGALKAFANLQSGACRSGAYCLMKFIPQAWKPFRLQRRKLVLKFPQALTTRWRCRTVPESLWDEVSRDYCWITVLAEQQ
ncbi:FimD/PapC N-terminal domain-containing protein [Escherichia coli]